MKASKSNWYPTKFEYHRGRWRAKRQGGVGSRLMGDLQVIAYQWALERYARGHLVDLGCGNAPLCGIYRSLVTDYTWVDWPNSHHQLFAVDCEANLNERLPFADHLFDTVLLSDVLEHICEPDLLFAEMSRILRPGGRIILGVPFLYPIHEEPHDHNRYTKFKLGHFGKKHGVTPLEIREVGGAFDSWTDLSGKLLGAVWRPLARLPYHGWVLMKRVPAIRRLNDAGAWRFPIAYIAVYEKPGTSFKLSEPNSTTERPA